MIGFAFTSCRPGKLAPTVRITIVAALLGACCCPGRLAAAEIPSWLPKYDLDIHVDVEAHQVHVRERVTWVNRHDCPAHELVFNAHSHYQVPGGEVGFLAKMAEILRMAPSETIDFDGPPCQVAKVLLLDRAARSSGGQGPGQPSPERQGGDGPRETLPEPKALPVTATEVAFHWQHDNDTALVVPLPEPVAQGESVTVELVFTLRLPKKQGRWGQWQGVTFLSQWLPVLACFDEKGWQPTPFIPWHQPFFNEAGVYRARVTLPCNQKLACTGSIVAAQEIGAGWQQLEIHCPAARDFALLASARYEEYVEQAGPVRLKVLAFPEHEHYARVLLRVLAEALPVYSRWFGPFPYPEFTVAESYFGWNGNECGGLIMIDERMFGMPHLAECYLDYLVSHEFCHQWWYNVVGTNGHCETWMDEGLATYFSHRLLNQKYGKNNNLLHYPRCLEWLPSIYRENYRYYGLYGSLGRGEYCATVGAIPKFSHLVNLLSMCYDKGGKIVGMIEERLGEAAFLDFMRIIYAKYYFRILRVADFQRELEEFTGQSWEPFFRDWLYGNGITDWAIDKVRVTKIRGPSSMPWGGGPAADSEQEECTFLDALHTPPQAQPKRLYRVTVDLSQKGDYNEPTTVGICLNEDGRHYCIRLPVMPGVERIELADPPARIETLPARHDQDGGDRVRIVVYLPTEPKQIAVDPDHVLVDRNPANNYWKSWYRWRFTPVYTFLEETDLTNDYDKWNFIFGPWFFFPAAYADPWFTRSTMFGLRLDAYRTQTFDGGVFSAYRYDYRDVVAGVDGLWDHFPCAHTQLGFVAERRLAAGFARSNEHANRGVVYGRYVFTYGSSLYLPPMNYVEAFCTAQDNFLPVPNQSLPGGQRYRMMTMGGLHYYLNYLTPYWDAEAGFLFDATLGSGMAQLDKKESFHQFTGQFSTVHGLPDWTGPLSHTRLAVHLFAAAALPDEIEFFPLGGEDRFRGFTIADRQGSLVWVTSLEWRVPVARHLRHDCCDHIIGLRNVYLAGFYDLGNAYLKGQPVAHAAHAFGAGLRVDVAWFSIIERTILRLDVAKTINESSPVQVWIGIQHPF